ncbi:hypothetical protein [Pontibacter pamirensis]|uniref:hypothetical protein n=1 Tax=Pontibacter pamirensis TaxID=2562824 RepID=UPI001389EC9D|nr:hypothetical protein [Pontibacter pamirensis]
MPVAGGESRQLTNSTYNSVFVISYFPKYFDLYEMDLQSLSPEPVMQNEQGFDVAAI